MTGATQRIAVITTGGTIGSLLKEGDDRINTNIAGEAALRDKLQSIASRSGWLAEVFRSLNKPSEEMEPYDWFIILRSIRDAVSRGYDKVVVTHGTDTLHFTAAFLSCGFNDPNVKVCLTGSFFPPNVEHSDAASNLITAFACVTDNQIPPGVYVAFSDGNEGSRVLLARDVKPMSNDGCTFDPLYGRIVATRTGSDPLLIAGHSNLIQKPIIPTSSLPTPKAVEHAVRSALILRAYPGLMLDYILQGKTNIRYVVIEQYHSGTAPSGSDGGVLQALNKNRSAKGVLRIRSTRTFFFCSHPAQLLKIAYANTVALANAGGWVMRDWQVHELYAFLILYLSQGKGEREILDALISWRLPQALR